MAIETIALLSPGDMGHVVGAVLREKGFRVLTLLDGRSDLTRQRAERVGMEDGENLGSLVKTADLIMSIMPPSAACDFAETCARAMVAAGVAPLFVDCNAVSPASTETMGKSLQKAGAKFVKVGIIGPPPREGVQTRFYASGSGAELIDFLDGGGISFRDMGPEITTAAAMKMCYAGLTKGGNTLNTLIATAAELLGISQPLRQELADSQPAALRAMNARIPTLAADAGRWAGEMDEIAATFGAIGLTSNMHKGAGDMFRLLHSTPLGAESRETADRGRTLDETVRIFSATVRQGKASS